MSHSQLVWLKSVFAVSVPGGEASVHSSCELSVTCLEQNNSLNSLQHGEDEPEVGGFPELRSCRCILVSTEESGWMRSDLCEIEP